MEFSVMSSSWRWRGGKSRYFCWDWTGQERIIPLQRTSSLTPVLGTLVELAPRAFDFVCCPASVSHVSVR